jgi:molecular chaperone GrpE
VLRQVRFVPLRDRLLLAVVVTREGLRSECVIETAAAPTPEEVERANELLAARVQGGTLREVRRELEVELRAAARRIDRDRASALWLAFQAFGAPRPEVLVEGELNLVENRALPMERLRDALAALRDRERLAGRLDRRVVGPAGAARPRARRFPVRRGGRARHDRRARAGAPGLRAGRGSAGRRGSHPHLHARRATRVTVRDDDIRLRAASEDGADPPAGGETPQEAPDPLAQATAERDRYRDQMLRTAADFDNFRKRARRELEEMRARGRDDMLREILPVFDNFERALEHATGEDPTAVLEGIAMVHKLLADTLERSGVQVVDEVGVAFDPALHDALQQEPTSEVPPGTVVRIVQKGYRTKDRLIRPATVVVAAPPKPAE